MRRKHNRDGGVARPVLALVADDAHEALDRRLDPLAREVARLAARAEEAS
jgi:hypothetical protein